MSESFEWVKRQLNDLWDLIVELLRGYVKKANPPDDKAPSWSEVIAGNTGRDAMLSSSRTVNIPLPKGLSGRLELQLSRMISMSIAQSSIIVV